MENKRNCFELFSRDKTVFHCETEELGNQLLIIADKLGYKWVNNDSFCGHNSWVDHTCYNINRGTFGDLSLYKIYMFNIINVNELLNARTFKLKRNEK